MLQEWTGCSSGRTISFSFSCTLLSDHDKAAHFTKKIRIYNSLFSVYLGGKIDRKITNGWDCIFLSLMIRIII